ncbi:MAG: S-adenosylmethionine synthetase [Candidatus Methanoperedens nitroreducens]|uniref:S-adenosylmethionine synthetase n=1 Tax=Candidatus Methanoperedens nitratireducens TaxID=1392998 RepID=A0A0P8AKF8_9EURY|nr:methionine adenosyltransferase [Candidatus Methanoperedens sp. BLZ2]KAB2946316.1 MAG: methionine adenosyltransferase [Candidatus Methanoperedens sp.]KPQ45292.1 MAG: S-adenosylmethionine synthetase [Candidatus Methanoperedens sp. BLZ1]MBZ0176072.1 methionine adenosyltransferase [Candidatus Methanoperedens nitroreducens]MCX9076801.1 methionine adenosyltransferase [Candidatus Methanoperedens sp.]
MRNIEIEEFRATPITERKVEVVERKGLGHPDYICDSIMNEVSIRLCKEYMERFGAIMHHNIDKGMLVAGEVKTKFGGGVILKPMRIIFGDRATFEVENEFIDVNTIAIGAAKEWIKKNLRFVNSDSIYYQVELARGSAELTDIFKRKDAILGANDTSAAVGYAPMTPTETMVLQTEQYLNSPDFKKRFPESGEDIKVMGLREKNKLSLTIADPLIDMFIESESGYFKKKAELAEEIRTYVIERTEFEPSISLNTLDREGRGMGGIYLTVTGTSAEDADSGQVGRGNRVNGIIPLNRPVSSEAAAGKNPVSHVGKIYNVLSHRIANEIYVNVPDIKEVYVWLLSQIGEPIDQPRIAAAQVIMERGTVESVEKEMNEVIDRELANIQEFCMELAYGKIPVN